jgi:tetratricopeptide (TPR) repeat protein
MVERSENLQRGISLFEEGDFEHAVPLIEAVSREEPDNYEAFVYLGAAYAHQSRHNASIGALKRAASINPGSAKIHYNLGQAYELGGVPQEAWFEYTRALELDSNYGLARGALVVLSRRLPALLKPAIEIAA